MGEKDSDIDICGRFLMGDEFRQLLDMPEWAGVLEALLECDPGHADLLEALIRNLKPVETVFDAQNSWMAQYQSMVDEMDRE